MGESKKPSGPTDLSTDPIGLSAHWDGSSIGVGIRSRFATAVDRLAGNFADIPNWFVEAAKARRQAKESKAQAIDDAKTEVQIALIRAEGDVAVRKLLSSSDAGDRVLRGFLQSESIKQENRRAVLVEAGETLKQLPPPDPDDDHDGAAPDIDLDWLNVFGDYAARASSDELRQLWGRILAGEIRTPKSFSLSTLRTVSEMDRDIALAFEAVLEDRVGDHILMDKDDREQSNRLLFLEEIGLVLAADQTLSLNLNADEHGMIYIVNAGYYLGMKKKAPEPPTRPGLPSFDMSSFMSMQVPIARMTRVAREIAEILPSRDPIKPLREIAKRLDGDMEKIALMKFEGDKGVLVQTLK